MKDFLKSGLGKVIAIAVFGALLALSQAFCPPCVDLVKMAQNAVLPVEAPAAPAP